MNDYRLGMKNVLEYKLVLGNVGQNSAISTTQNQQCDQAFSIIVYIVNNFKITKRVTRVNELRNQLSFRSKRENVKYLYLYRVLCKRKTTITLKSYEEHTIFCQRTYDARFV